ncbi:MAG: gamma-glutamyl-gamma-aminobutyrate hydrolase family protein [Candidatus Nanopelagicales bacterium]|nr:gamma-glutamyl-gamma-aminobutyrate hydrolase family protein [Candidatus Nanopelagicales bacterium]
MNQPVIGLTSYLEPAKWGAWDQPAALIPWNYVNKLQAAGATVVILPPDADNHDAISRLDGLVMAGGADIEPARYGAAHQEGTDKPRTERDASELGLYRAARDANLPVFGICRGLQIMAVAHGGSLHQHLPDVVGNTLHRDAPGTFNDHGATFTPGSLIAELVGATDVTVNSSHHQAVDSPGDLKVTGYAEDGTIEVCEDPSAEFVLGVQWHPEFSNDEQVSENLFRAFVKACANR